MSGQNAQKLEDFFQDLCTHMRDNKPIKEVETKLREKIEATPLEVLRYLRTSGEHITTSRAIMHGISRALAPQAVKLKLDKGIHLEHIAPQTETDGWLDDLFSGNKDLFREYDRLVKEAGNLTLLDPTINVGIGQDSFLDKKKQYKKSVFYITTNLSDLQAWRQEHIEARTEWVAECFNAIWALDKQKEKIADFDEWFRRLR